MSTRTPDSAAPLGIISTLPPSEHHGPPADWRALLAWLHETAVPSLLAQRPLSWTLQSLHGTTL